jgi:tetratricopeptide (TPR) repeat protein
MNQQKDLINFNEMKGQLAITINNKGLSLFHQKKFPGAISFFKESLDLMKQNFLNHPIYISVLNNLGMALTSDSQFEEALNVLQNSEKLITKNTNQMNTYEAGVTFANLGKLKFELKGFKEAEEYNRKSLKILKKCLPDDHKQIGLVSANLAVCLLENKGDKKEIEQLIKEAKRITVKNSFEIPEAFKKFFN